MTGFFEDLQEDEQELIALRTLVGVTREALHTPPPPIAQRAADTHRQLLLPLPPSRSSEFTPTQRNRGNDEEYTPSDPSSDESDKDCSPTSVTEIQGRRKPNIKLPDTVTRTSEEIKAALPDVPGWHERRAFVTTTEVKVRLGLGCVCLSINSLFICPRRLWLTRSARHCLLRFTKALVTARRKQVQPQPHFDASFLFFNLVTTWKRQTQLY